MQSVTLTDAWTRLKTQGQQFNQSVGDLFASNPHRFRQFSLQVGELLFDYSKQRVQAETLTLLCDLARAAGLPQAIEDLFTGQAINRSENRAVLHTALRDLDPAALPVEGKDIKPAIQAVLDQLEIFSEKLRSKTYLSASGRPFTDILCLGIGGSELGPVLLDQALSPYKTAALQLHFVSNVDASLPQLLKKLDPHQTLCIISSKTFTTAETLENVKAVKAWFRAALPKEANVAQNLVAVTANRKRAEQFGILPEQVFELWDWVGGRYSIWSAVGLPLILSLGMPHFKAFLAGAKAMDTHFRTAAFHENMPVLMALIGIWNRNVLEFPTLAIMPYDQRLYHFPAYLQQLEMESNGKAVNQTGDPVDYQTAPIIWGGVGCDGQHAFMQLLHQGTQIVPVDFLIGLETEGNDSDRQKLLFANCLAQAKALMEGVEAESVVEGSYALASAKTCFGNRPSSLLVYPKLSPFVLGSLIALYEHKVFVQGVIWDINSFDQWGVERGKTLAKDILALLKEPSFAGNLAGSSENKLDSLDSSTQGLINFFNQTEKN